MGQICGFGKEGYIFAVEGLIVRLSEKKFNK
ncbi:hypothetical protein [Fusobacterium varium]